jgi:hypothetical protein
MARKYAEEMQGDDLTKLKQKAAPEKQCNIPRTGYALNPCTQNIFQAHTPGGKGNAWNAQNNECNEVNRQQKSMEKEAFVNT